MARPREFVQSEVVDRALLLFWRVGFEGCAVRDLLAATGVPRQSLYNTFGDKHGLFVAALSRYRELARASLEPLRQPDASLGSVMNYVRNVLALQKKEDVGACLIVKTSFGPASPDAAVRKAVEAGAAEVRDTFARVFTACKARGEVRASLEPRAAAAYVYVSLHGLSALARTGGSPAAIDKVLAHVTDSLRA